MDTDQTAQMVAWLDEERRKDKAVISRLEERVASQTALIDDQNRRQQTLDSELAALKTKYATMSFVDDTMVRLRNELTSSQTQLEQRRDSLGQDLKQMREIDREALMKAVDDLRQEMLTRIEREIQPRRAEEERLSRVAFELQNYADSLSKGLEEFEHTLNFLEEQRRQDSRRISELADFPKRFDSIDPKLELLEEISRRNERSIETLSKGLNDFKQERRKWLEEQAIIDQKRESILSDMKQRIDAFSEDMDAYALQVSGWADTHRAMKKNIDDFDRLVDRVDRRVNEVSEVQRLSEERFRREWEEFQQEDQRRFRQFTLTNEEAWRENNKLVEEIQGKLAHNIERIEHMIEHLKQSKAQQRQFMKLMTEQAQTTLDDYDDSLLPPLT